MPLLAYVKDYFVPAQRNAYRPKLLHRSWLLFFLAVILATEGFLVADLVARQSNQNFLAAVVPGEIIALTNGERTQNSLGQVTDNKQLDVAAQAKADDMAKLGYFSHTGPDGKTPWQWIAGSGYAYQYAGENLAVRFIDSSDVVNAWMASPTHRANILKPVYTEIGVGVAQGIFQGQPATYVVQYFATPLGTAAPAAAAASNPPVQNFVPASVPAQASAQAPQVEGAAVAAAPTPAPAPGASFTQSLSRQLMRVLAEPKNASNWILGGAATLLILALFLTFFVHVHIQSSNMIMGGVVVAVIALSFLALNTHLSENASGGGAAAASQALVSGAPMIDTGAASTGYTLFP